MREFNDRSKWQQVKGKRLLHWGVLTLDDLPKSNPRYMKLIAQLRARYLASKELEAGKPK